MKRTKLGSSANKCGKIFLWILGSGVILFCLLLAFFLFLPSLINIEPLREKIITVVSETVGSPFRYERIDLSYFPSPRAVIRQVKISGPGNVSATLKSLTVYPKWSALLKGKVQITLVRIEAPNVRMWLPKGPGKKGEEKESWSPASLAEEMFSAVAQVTAKTGSLNIAVDKGSLDLSGENGPVFWVRDIDATISLGTHRLKMDLACHSNLWERASITTDINPVGFRGQGRIDLVNFHPHALTESVLRTTPLRLKDSAVNLKISFRTEGKETLQTEMEGSIPLLSFVRKNAETAVRGRAFKAAFQMEGKRVNVALAELDLDYPKLRLSGKFQSNPEAPGVVLEVQGRAMEIASTREVALTLAGKFPITETIFNIVKGGQIPLITFESRGRSIKDLDETENFSIKGSLQEGKISIPAEGFGGKGNDFDLDKVSGEVIISKGILDGKNIRARIEDEEIREGQIRVGLEGKDAPFHLEVVSEIDLSRLPPLLNRVIKDTTFLQELARTHDLRGRSVGKLVLGETVQSIGATVEIWEMNLFARYERVPFPLKIDHGQFSFDGKGIGLKSLSGRIGKSSFSGLTARLDLGKEPTFETLSGEFSISLGEIYPWLASFEGLREVLNDIEAVKGTLSLTVKNLEGPLQEFRRWRFEASGKVGGLSTKMPLFPESIEVAAGTFRADTEELSFAEFQVSMLGASYNISGHLAGYLKGPFQVDLRSQVDLARLPPILKHLLNNETFERELSLIENLKGNATARLVLDDPGGKGRFRLEVSALSASINYRRIPYLIEISRAEISYGERKIGIKTLSGALGKSSVSDLAGQLDFGKEPHLEIQSGKLSIALDEIYTWLSPQEFAQDAVKEVKSVGGTLRLSEVNLKGPLQKPEDWNFRVSGDVSAVMIETTFVPGPITVTRGKFRADPDRLFVSHFEMNVLDASLNVSGTLDACSRGIEKAEMDLNGRLTPKDTKWLSDLLRFKHKMNMRAPFSISGGHLSWHKGAQTSFKGELALNNGPQISLDILQNSGQLRVNRLFIQDEFSRATIMLDLQGRALGLAFSGTLSETTLDRIFSGYHLQEGWVKGDFKAQILMDTPMQSTAQGRLEVRNLSFPWQLEKALELEDIILEGRGNHISVSRAAFAWGDRHFSLSGDVTFKQDKLRLDIDVATGDLDMDEVMKSFGRENEAKHSKDGADLRVEGHIRFHAKSLTYDRFTWNPFQANISFVPDRVHIDVIRADLCGISTTGTVEVASQNLSLDVQTLARDRNIDFTVRCLLDENIRMTGGFDLTGSFQGQGEVKTLTQSLQGNYELTARKGRIDRSNLLSRIFAFLNVTEVLRGKLPDLGQKGFAYDSINVRADLKTGKAVIKEATLKGPSMEIASRGEIDLIGRKINLTVVVAPFRTIDYVISKIPLIRYVLGGSLISMPVKVTGDLKDPRVTPLSPSAVGSDLLGIMKRTLDLPVRMIQPFWPKGEEEKNILFDEPKK
jgi:hypothetical protein